MDFTHLFIEEKYLEALGWTLAHSVWQIALTSLLLWFLLKIISKKASNFRYGAALTALMLVFTASSWTFVHHLSQNEKIQTTHSFVHVNFEETPQRTLDSESTLGSLGFWDFLSLQMEPHLTFLVNLWILGASFFLVRFVGSFYDLQKLHNKHHEYVSLTLLKKVDSLTASLGIFRKVKVLKSSLVHAPVTYGIIKPVILFPVSLVFSMAPDQLEAIIAHELAHIKRYDYLANIFQSVLEILFFFHPCFWWINDIINEERENATDDLALSRGISPKALALALAEVANHSSYRTPEMTLAASANKSLTLQRIKRILGRSTPSPKLSPIMTMTMIFTLIISTLLMVGAKGPEKKMDEPILLTRLKSQTTTWDDTIPVTPRQEIVFKIEKKDTIPAKKSTKAPKVADMPKLELTPTPKMDFQFPSMPEIPPAPPAPMAKSYFPDHDIDLDIRVQADSMGKIARELEKLKDKDSPEAKSRTQTLQSALAKVQQNMEVLSQDFADKMEDWQEINGESMKKFEAEMKVWEEKMKEHEKSWKESFTPKMKEFEEKMKEWEKENAPRIKEFEEKMKIWQEKNQQKIESMNSTKSNRFIHLNDFLKPDKMVAC